MNLTRNQFLEMSENDLRENILIPLLRKMGFKNVSSYHGGTMERGKDIVMWKTDNLRGRVNCAAVISAKKITGKPDGPGSAGRIYAQVAQCFSESYPDPAMPESRDVGYCLVICPHEIKKEARMVLQQLLSQNNHLDRLVSYMHGDELWDLVQSYLPSNPLTDAAQDLMSQISSMNGDFDVNAKIDGKDVAFGITPKKGITDLESLGISAEFKFPDTPKGKKVYEALQKHFKTGEAVTIDKDFFEITGLPKQLADIMLAPGMEITGLEFRARQGLKPLIAQVELIPPEGESVFLDYIHFEFTSVGQEQFTIDNSRQPVPWHIRIILGRQKPKGNFSFSFDSEGVNVKQLLHIQKVIRAIQKGAIIRVREYASGLRFIDAGAQEVNIEGSTDDITPVLEKLVFIQERTGILISINQEVISEKEMVHIHQIEEIIKTGKINLPAQAISFTVTKDGARQLVEEHSKQNEHTITVEQHQPHVLFGIPIDLGPCKMEAKGVKFNSKDFKNMKKMLSKSYQEEKIAVRLDKTKNTDLTLQYYNWPK